MGLLTNGLEAAVSAAIVWACTYLLAMIKHPLNGDVNSRCNSWTDFASACCLSSTAWLLSSYGGCLQGVQDHLHHLLAQQTSDTQRVSRKHSKG